MGAVVSHVLWLGTEMHARRRLYTVAAGVGLALPPIRRLARAMRAACLRTPDDLAGMVSQLTPDGSLLDPYADIAESAALAVLDALGAREYVMECLEAGVAGRRRLRQDAGLRGRRWGLRRERGAVPCVPHAHRRAIGGALMAGVRARHPQGLQGGSHSIVAASPMPHVPAWHL